MTTNAFLIRWGGGWAERVSTASIDDVGRCEGLLGLGALGSLAEVNRVADGQLDEFARVRTQTDVLIAPVDAFDTPYQAFFVGDTVTVEGVEHRVLSVTVSEDENGNPIYVPTLNDDVILVAEERIAQAITKMIPGTLGGRSKVAQPVVPVYVPRGLSPDPDIEIPTEPVGHWTLLASHPNEYPLSLCAADDGLIYSNTAWITLGGSGDNSKFLNAYDPDTDTWSADLATPPLAPQPVAPILFNGGGDLLIGLEHNQFNTPDDVGWPVSEYDIGTDTWSTTRDATNSYIGNKMGIPEGTDNLYGLNSYPTSSELVGILSYYDISSDGWVGRADFPPDSTTTTTGKAAFNGTNCYLFGGLDTTQLIPTDYPWGVWRYNATGNSWTELLDATEVPWDTDTAFVYNAVAVSSDLILVVLADQECWLYSIDDNAFTLTEACPLTFGLDAVFPTRIDNEAFVYGSGFAKYTLDVE